MDKYDRKLKILIFTNFSYLKQLFFEIDCILGKF